MTDMRMEDALAEIERLQHECKTWHDCYDNERAESTRLRVLSAELCEAMDDCITWLSSGFAPQSQSIALEKAAKARAKFRALEHKP